jgi:hypothetical protein
LMLHADNMTGHRSLLFPTSEVTFKESPAVHKYSYVSFFNSK